MITIGNLYQTINGQDNLKQKSRPGWHWCLEISESRTAGNISFFLDMACPMEPFFDGLPEIIKSPGKIEERIKQCCHLQRSQDRNQPTFILRAIIRSPIARSTKSAMMADQKTSHIEREIKRLLKPDKDGSYKRINAPLNSCTFNPAQEISEPLFNQPNR